MNKFDDEFDNGPAFDNVPDNEFELEMIDLPPDEEISRLVAFVVEGLRILSNVRTGSSELMEQGGHRLDGTREWLLEEKSEQTIREYTPESEFELEMSDLPPEVVSNTRWLELFERFRSHLPFKRRLWRMGLVIVTILLMLIFLLGSMPDAYKSIVSIFVHLTPIPAASNSTTISSESSIFVEDPSLATVTISQTPVVTWSNDGGTPVSVGPLPPAPMPTNCPPGDPVHNSTVSGTSVWVRGFSGPLSSIHLPDFPSRTIPQWHGWPVHLIITVPANFTDEMTISGEDMFYSRPLLFQVDPDPGLALELPLNTSQSPGVPSVVDGEQGRSWNVTMYVYASGCYFLHTAWSNGELSIPFAAGL